MEGEWICSVVMAEMVITKECDKIVVKKLSLMIVVHAYLTYDSNSLVMILCLLNRHYLERLYLNDFESSEAKTERCTSPSPLGNWKKISFKFHLHEESCSVSPCLS